MIDLTKTRGRKTAEGKQNIYINIGGKEFKRSTTNLSMRSMIQTGTDELHVQFAGSDSIYKYTSHPKYPGHLAGIMQKMTLSETGTPHSAGKIFANEIRNSQKIITKKLKPGSPEHIKYVTKYGILK